MSDTLDMRALARRLAPIYVKDDLATGGITRAGLARLCDEAIDPSGRLLSYIWKEAFPYKKTAQRVAASPAPRDQTPDACAFPASHAPANAEGWKLVPSEANLSMLDAGRRAKKMGDDVSRIYRAMLAAAPASPAPANAEDTLQILQANEGCFKAGVCKSLPCNCASELAALAAAPASPAPANAEGQIEAKDAAAWLRNLAKNCADGVPGMKPEDHHGWDIAKLLDRLAAAPAAPPDDALARALEIVYEEWFQAVKEFGLRPGSSIEKVVRSIINRIDALQGPGCTQKVGQDSSAMAGRSVRSGDRS